MRVREPGPVSASGAGLAVGGDVDLRAEGAGSVAAQSIGQVTFQAAPAGPVEWPVQVGVIPPPAGAFQDRGDRVRLRQAVDGGGTAVLCQVLLGMGGVGKTQLAGDYARTALADGTVDLLVWVNAVDRQALVARLAQAAAAVGVPGAAGRDPVAAAEAFVAWLEPKAGRPPRRWLVVLDDLTDPADLAGLWPPASPVGRTLITTRRQDAALTGPGRRSVTVGAFTPAEAVAYLAASTTTPAPEPEPATPDADSTGADGPATGVRAPGEQAAEDATAPRSAAHRADLPGADESATGVRPPGERAAVGPVAPERDPSGADLTREVRPHTAEGADRHDVELAGLARDLGYLPLALAQAAAYIAEGGIPVRAYRDLLAGRARGPVRTLSDVSPDVLPDDQRRGMAAAWELSVEYADRLRPAGLARPMLELAAFLTPAGIPATVLTSPPALAYLAAHRTPPAPGQGPLDPDDAARALRALHRLSLLTAPGPAAENQAVRIHQVVQRATRDGLDPQRYADAARATADALVAVWPGVERDTAFAQALRACATALTVATDSGGRTDVLYGGRVHAVLFRAGRSLGDSGGAAAARDYFVRVLATARRELGDDHPGTLVARSDVATHQGKAGDAAGAAAAFAALIADQIRLLGPDHRDTLASRGSLAFWLGAAGDVAGAVAVYTRLLADQLRVLGPEHADTLASRAGLAHWQGESGDIAGAARSATELIATQTRLFGPDHPNTLIARSSLASWQGESGDITGAVASYARLLDDHVRVLGPDHPGTLSTRSQLANWRGESGDIDAAVDGYAELLDDRLRILGHDHPDVLSTRSNLARWRGEAGDAEGAVRETAALLDDRVRVLGPDHPLTLLTRSNLARWRGKAGDPAAAVAACTELVADDLRVLGPDHAYTLSARANLAYWRAELGDAAGAAAEFAALLTDEIRVLGPDHPRILSARNNLASVLGEAGDPAAAAAAFVEVVAEHVRVLGPDHPSTGRARDNLAHWQALATHPAEPEDHAPGAP